MLSFDLYREIVGTEVLMTFSKANLDLLQIPIIFNVKTMPARFAVQYETYMLMTLSARPESCIIVGHTHLWNVTGMRRFLTTPVW